MLPSQYDSAAVALATVGILGWVVRYMAKEATEALKDLRKAVDLNTGVTKETFTFLKNLNGELKQVVDSKRQNAKKTR